MAYAETSELARVLNLRNLSDEQEAALDRVLEAASTKIDDEVDRPSTDPLSGGHLLLAEQVCLAYAAELWKFQEVQFGLVGIGLETGPTYVPRDAWKKYAIQLESAKRQFGFA